jgi:tetratricopeptide (TPR) repeat protein
MRRGAPSVRPALVAAALLALGSAVAAPAQAACQLQQLVQLPVTMVGAQPTVPVKVNGKDALFLVDSGAFYSVISPAAAIRFGLKTVTTAGEIRGIGGVADTGVTKVDLFTLGELPLHGISFLVADGAGDAVAGILGENVLGVADVEYDLADGMVRLFKPDSCGPADNLGYWAGGAAAQLTLQHTARIGSTIDSGRQVQAIGMLDGQRINITFDTGASRSILKLSSAARAGVTPKTIGAKYEGLSTGFGPRAIDTWLAPFQAFALGSEQIQNTTLRMGAIELSNSDMLLGADFFLSHRIYVANSQGKLYLTYNGGPVFRLDRPSNTQAAAPAGTAPASPTDINTPTDAAGFARRGAAFAARFDYAHAIADYGRAAELEPANPARYRERGAVLAANRQPVLAMADFDRALRLKPDDEAALIARGTLHAQLHDEARARQDLEAAARLGAADPGAELRIADLYQRLDLFSDALSHDDHWIAANPKGGAMAEALNGRCWAHAVLKTGLDQALADCDAALKLRPRTVEILESRALVHMDRGELDAAVADYDAVLRILPRRAIALYGRAAAETRKGLKDPAAADIQAAVAIDPRVEDQAKRFGFAF